MPTRWRDGEALLDEPARRRLDLVLELEVAEVVADRALEGEAAAGAAAVVDLDDEVACGRRAWARMSTVVPQASTTRWACGPP
jgi:hypothetical protein